MQIYENLELYRSIFLSISIISVVIMDSSSTKIQKHSDFLSLPEGSICRLLLSRSPASI